MVRSLLFVPAIVAALSGADIVQNGDFARGASPGEWITVRAGGSAIEAWRVVRGDVDYVGTYWRPARGVRSVNLDGAVAGAIAQTLHTVAGTRYTLQFDVAPNPEGPPAVKHLRVRAGSTVASFDIATPPGASRAALPWTTHTLNFVANAASTDLVFESLDEGRVLWNGPIVAAVSVVPATGSAPPAAAPTPERTAVPTAPPTAAPTVRPTAAPTRAPAPPAKHATSTFAGAWLAAYPSRPVRLNLLQNDSHVVARVVDGSPTFFTGDTAFTFDAKGMSLVGLARCPGAGGGWHGATLARTSVDQLVLTIADCAHSTIQVDRAR